MRIASVSALSAWLLLAACSGNEAASSLQPAQGPLAQHARTTAAAHDVPGDLVLAIAVVERGLMLPAHRTLRDDDEVPIAGILELRRAHFDSLARGADLLGASEERLQTETDLGTEAGILVLAELGREVGASLDDWRSWAPAVEKLSGYRDSAQAKDYAAEVFRVLRAGGTFPAREGEEVVIAPHPEVPIPLTLSPPAMRALATPEFPGATWFQTSCTNKCNTTRNQTIDSIVIHDTEGGWHASVATLQYDPNKSVHYIIDEDGSRVGQFIPESYMGWHAGNSCWNNRSIGIEHVGYASKSFDIALYKKSVELVNSIRQRHDIPLDRARIVGHYQIPNPNKIGQCVSECRLGLDACMKSSDYGGASRHTDPGYNWQWCQYMEMLGGSCQCNDAWPRWNCTTDRTQMWRCNSGTLEKTTCAQPCQVMPLGTPDECVAAVDAGAGEGGGASDDDASTSDAAVVEDDAEAPVEDASGADATSGQDASTSDGSAPEQDADAPGEGPDASDAGSIDAPGPAPGDGSGTGTGDPAPESVDSEAGCCTVAPGGNGRDGRGLAMVALAVAALVVRRRGVDGGEESRQ